MLDTVLLTLLIIVWAFELFFFFVPLGNERSTVRRLPLITFAILAANTLIYFVSLPVTVQQDRAKEKAFKQIKLFIEDNREILADDQIRERLKETGLFRKEIESIEKKLQAEPANEDNYRSWLKGATASQLRKEIKPLLEDFDAADEAHLYNKYGLVRDGKWKVYQLLTYSFIHANSKIFGLIFPLHLFFNLITLFAVGFSIEDLWGRDLFLLFYLSGAIVASIPDALSGTGLIGASGAASAVMGAFLVRLPHTKIKLGWISLPLALPMLAFGKKPYGVAKVASYYYLAFFFVNQLLLWWFFNYKTSGGDGVSYRCHLTGFAYGAIFALTIKYFKVEEKHINPQIEAKIAFYLSPKITAALELLDNGEEKVAEKKLKALLSSYPHNPEILMALVQVYERIKNFPQLNESYSALIRHHLEKDDKEAALYAYDNLLLAFPDNHIEPQIPARDWLVLCEYLVELEMYHEASVEYERLATLCLDDESTLRACVQGGEAAMEAGDLQRAIRLFEKIVSKNAMDGFSARARLGLEQAQWLLARRTGALNTGMLPNITKPLPFASDA
ncbi:MAG: rhomboid family intramembrane serine protease [Acidobacteria bacterium]|nr:rhomboid family intramembrane serine protease [Acidobacteriota bacterium]